jgi:hypothetical protein
VASDGVDAVRVARGSVDPKCPPSLGLHVIQRELEDLFEDVTHEIGSQGTFVGEQQSIEHGGLPLGTEELRAAALLDVFDALHQIQPLVKELKELAVDVVDLPAEGA